MRQTDSVPARRPQDVFNLGCPCVRVVTPDGIPPHRFSVLESPYIADEEIGGGRGSREEL